MVVNQPARAQKADVSIRPPLQQDDLHPCEALRQWNPEDDPVADTYFSAGRRGLRVTVFITHHSVGGVTFLIKLLFHGEDIHALVGHFTPREELCAVVQKIVSARE